MNWHVYHYRGLLVHSFATEREALQYIDKQTIPSEYYREYQENKYV